MKKGSKKILGLSVSALAAFVLWTVLVCTFDVGEIGPRGSSVGFATLNGFLSELIGTNMLLYNITDWFGIVPIAVAFGFAILGLCQWIKRKSIFLVDRSIIALGVFYIAVFAAYVLFEILAINYRPVLIDGCLEASYPSSTTLLVLCIIPTALMQLCRRIKNITLKRSVLSIGMLFVGFTVIGRVISGVHWISDIIGGALLAVGLVLMYAVFANDEK
jgi:undecaprenyl-diphosphatase